MKPQVPLNPGSCIYDWETRSHLAEWSENIGAINYLSGKGCNAFFLTYNAGGDGDNVWPFVLRDDKLHYDCSKLDQWQMVFDHGTAKGCTCISKCKKRKMTTSDTEVNHRCSEALDGGSLGKERMLYCCELRLLRTCPRFELEFR